MPQSLLPRMLLTQHGVPCSRNRLTQVSENRELSDANAELKEQCRDLHNELSALRSRSESDQRAASEAHAALRSQNASLLKKHQAAAEQVARLQLQLAKLTNQENERILRDASFRSSGPRSPHTSAHASERLAGSGLSDVASAAAFSGPPPGNGRTAEHQLDDEDDILLGTGRGSRERRTGGSGRSQRLQAPDSAHQRATGRTSPSPRPVDGRASAWRLRGDAMRGEGGPLQSPHAQLLDEIDRSIESMAEQGKAVVERYAAGSVAHEHAEGAASGAGGGGTAGRLRASALAAVPRGRAMDGGDNHAPERSDSQPGRHADVRSDSRSDIWAEERESAGSRGGGHAALFSSSPPPHRPPRSQIAGRDEAPPPTQSRERSGHSAARERAHDTAAGTWISAQTPFPGSSAGSRPASGRQDPTADAGGTVDDAASFFGRLQATLNRDDLAHLMGILSEFNDAIITQDEAVRRANIILKHYGAIRHEFEDFMRVSAQG